MVSRSRKKMAEKIAQNARLAVASGTCIKCKAKVWIENEKEFPKEKYRKEYERSGLCLKCQSKMYDIPKEDLQNI